MLMRCGSILTIIFENTSSAWVNEVRKYASFFYDLRRMVLGFYLFDNFFNLTFFVNNEGSTFDTQKLFSHEFFGAHTS